ncbi:Clavaminate synthase-like protein [Moniliophthora roreri]|nr:Clavaminate synthase-like protein [Moniliophthora roreri]
MSLIRRRLDDTMDGCTVESACKELHGVACVDDLQRPRQRHRQTVLKIRSLTTAFSMCFTQRHFPSGLCT